MNKVNILGFPVSSSSVDELSSLILKSVKTGSRNRYFACLNPHSYEISRKDPVFSASLRNADFLIPDGIGIILASRLLSNRLHARITGMDLFCALNHQANIDKTISCFFLGTRRNVLDLIKINMQHLYPNIIWAGSFAPSFADRFSEEENISIVQQINAVKPDILWIGMTAPKQEKWVYENKDRLDTGFIGPIGAAFDFFAGTQPRCPQLLQKLGIEWLFRLIVNPSRLWERTFISAPLFLTRTLIEKCKLTIRKN